MIYSHPFFFYGQDPKRKAGNNEAGEHDNLMVFLFLFFYLFSIFFSFFVMPLKTPEPEPFSLRYIPV